MSDFISTFKYVSDFELNIFYNVPVLNQIFEQASDFELKILQRVRYWITFLNMRDFLNWIFYKPSDFGLKNFHRVMFWIKNFSSRQILNKPLQSKCHVLVLFNPWKRHLLHFLWCFKKHNFELKLLLRVRIRIEKNTTCQSPK